MRSILRTLFVLSKVLGWASRRVDYVQVFLQDWSQGAVRHSVSKTERYKVILPALGGCMTDVSW